MGMAVSVAEHWMTLGDTHVNASIHIYNIHISMDICVYIHIIYTFILIMKTGKYEDMIYT